VRFYFTGTEFLYDYNANLSKAVGAKRLPLTGELPVAHEHRRFTEMDATPV